MTCDSKTWYIQLKLQFYILISFIKLCLSTWNIPQKINRLSEKLQICSVAPDSPFLSAVLHTEKTSVRNKSMNVFFFKHPLNILKTKKKYLYLCLLLLLLLWQPFFNEMAHEKVPGRACVFGTGLTHLFSTSLTNNSIIATLCIESRHSLKL